MKDRYAYIAVLEYDDDGISIYFPDLPGCLPCAQTTEEALKNAKEAMGLHLYGMERDGDDIPDPTNINDIQLPRGGVPVLIDVFMPPVRDRAKTRFVKKTLTVPAWLASKAEEDGVNFSKILQNALIDYLDLRDNNQPR